MTSLPCTGVHRPYVKEARARKQVIFKENGSRNNFALRSSKRTTLDQHSRFATDFDDTNKEFFLQFIDLIKPVWHIVKVLQSRSKYFGTNILKQYPRG